MPDSLDQYAARILAGTSITPDEARLIATGHLPAPGTFATALHDGYTAPLPTPRPTTGDDTP